MEINTIWMLQQTNVWIIAHQIIIEIKTIQQDVIKNVLMAFILMMYFINVPMIVWVCIKIIWLWNALVMIDAHTTKYSIFRHLVIRSVIVVFKYAHHNIIKVFTINHALNIAIHQFNIKFLNWDYVWVRFQIMIIYKKRYL